MAFIFDEQERSIDELVGTDAVMDDFVEELAYLNENQAELSADYIAFVDDFIASMRLSLLKMEEQLNQIKAKHL